MSDVGAYHLQLYCDHPECPGPEVRGPSGITVAINNQYEGRNRAECVAQARRDGWILHRDGRCTCPKCRGKR